MAEALPFVQAGIPEQSYGVGVKAGKKGSGETPDPQLFADLMAQYAPNPQADKTGESSEPPTLKAIVDDPHGASASFSPAVLELLASLMEDVPPAGGALSLPHESGSAEQDMENTPEDELSSRFVFSDKFFKGHDAGKKPLGGIGQEAEGQMAETPLAEVGLPERGPLPQPQSAVPPFNEGGSFEDAMEQPLWGADAPLDGALSPEGRTAGEGEPLPAEAEKKSEGQASVMAETLLAGAAPQVAGVPLSGTRAVLEEASRHGDLKTASQTSVGGAESERAGTMDAPELSPSLARSGERRGEPGASEEKDASGDDGTPRRRARAAVSEASRQKDTEELPRSERGGADFQSFFDGILENRRLAQPAAPLELTRSALPNPGEVLREGVENVVRFARVNGEQRASLIVDPPALGRLTVELASGTSGLEASIKVSSEQVRYLVQDQIAQLRMSLAQQGVQLAHFSVDVQQDDGRRQQGFERGQGRGRRRGGASGEDDEAANAVFRVDLNEGLLHWVG